MKNEIPKIYKDGDCFTVYAPDNTVAARFYNQALLEAMLRDTFGLSAFEPIPLQEKETAAGLLLKVTVEQPPQFPAEDLPF